MINHDDNDDIIVNINKLSFVIKYSISSNKHEIDVSIINIILTDETWTLNNFP